jgi:glyoxylase-like metal-dependent hydrolase (beta-lactamase superfamily II)
MLITDRLGLVASLQFGIGSRYDCHVYALRTGDDVILIDTGAGCETDALLTEVNRCWPQAQVAAAILTHSHPDHACGASGLADRTSCSIYAPSTSVEAIREGDERATGLADARECGVYPKDVRLLPCPSAQAYTEGQALSICGQEFRPIRVRGHSDDSHCLATDVAGVRMLFAGDVLFYGAVLGVINHHDSGMSGYRSDLVKLAGLDIDALLPGHGLFTLRDGQKHIDKAIELVNKGFLPRQIGQMEVIF